jgi:hypothetical protein
MKYRVNIRWDEKELEEMTDEELSQVVDSFYRGLGTQHVVPHDVFVELGRRYDLRRKAS